MRLKRVLYLAFAVIMTDYGVKDSFKPLAVETSTTQSVAISSVTVQIPVAASDEPIVTMPVVSTEYSISTTEKTEKASVTITFVGDILIDRGVKRLYAEKGTDGIFLDEDFAYTSDITMINLEFPISSRGEPEPEKEYTFRGDPAHIGFLSELGVDIVAIANNHILDYGQDAFLDTLGLLQENSVMYVGGGKDYQEASSYQIIEVNGNKIAFLAASRVIPSVSWYAEKNRPGVFGTYNPEALLEKIEEASGEADYVIVYVHWGVERDSVPQEWQRNMAKSYIDAGASCVIGSHAHVLQGFEYYMGKPIVYGLGNFIFTDANKDTMAVTVILNDEISLSAKPYAIKNLLTSPVTDEAHRAKILRHLRDISFDVSIDDDFNISSKIK